MLVYRYCCGVAITLARARTFRSGNSQAVRLPRDFAFGDNVELVIIRSGDVMTIYPAGTTIAAMIDQLWALPAPPDIERRDDEDLPGPEGL